VRAGRAALSDDVLFVDWVNQGPVRANWGDAVAPVLAGALSGQRVVNRRDVLNVRRRPVHTTIGSMLGTIAVPAEVWGTGFVTSGAHLRARPAAVHAVRGPLTRQKLLDAGVPCPEVFGDPALLFPSLHRPTSRPTHRLGLIPHFRERDLPQVRRLAAADDVLFIDICAGIEAVADAVNRCELIASSSLHGMVLSDAYGIPAIWMTISDHPYGDGFKFRDYLTATSRRHTEPLSVDGSTSLAQVEDAFSDHHFEIDVPTFLAACPFLDEEVFSLTPGRSVTAPTSADRGMTDPATHGLS
jgi:pyruvyltransferase